MPDERIQRRINQLLDEADEAITALDRGTVQARAQAVPAFDPDNQDAQEYLQAAARATGEPSEAVGTRRGLEFAHSKGIVHRNLKPGNVWLTACGTAKIDEFGLAVTTDLGMRPSWSG